MPSRKELRQKNITSVPDIKLFWHPQGKYLCIKVITHTKSRKTLFHSFELLRVDEALVPIESLKMKDAAHAFAWEPNGHRFGWSMAMGLNHLFLSIPMLNKAGDAELTLLHTLEQKQCNSLHWSPQGQHCILAGTGDAFNGILEFYDVDSKAGRIVEHHLQLHRVGTRL